MKRILGIFLLWCVWLCSLQAKETVIVIYSTNDMHGSISSFAKIARYIASERTRYPHVLILSGGDMFSGNPVVDQYPQRGLPIIDLMNRTGYQYGAFGNHEFDYGQETLAQCIRAAGFEMLCANLHTDSIGLIRPKPYTFTETGGIRICILGLTETGKRYKGKPIPSAHPDRLKGLTFTAPLETALKYRYLRKECDLFIGLFHTGYQTDKKIAQAMPELDVIIGGHSHTRIPSTRLINGVLVTQAEDNLKHIGKTTLIFRDKRLIEKTFELIDVATLTEEDSLIRQRILKYEEAIPLQQVLAHATAQFDGRHPLGHLMADAITHISPTDFAFQNSGGIRIGMLPKGDITLEDVYRLDPFGNSVVVYEMTPSDIRTLLKNSYRKGDKSVDLIPSGLNYTLHIRDGKVTHITLTDKEGRPLDEGRRYTMGMNSYIASAYRFDKSLPHQEMQLKATDTLIEYLKRQQEVTPSKLRRGLIEEEK